MPSHPPPPPISPYVLPDPGPIVVIQQGKLVVVVVVINEEGRCPYSVDVYDQGSGIDRRPPAQRAWEGACPDE